MKKIVLKHALWEVGEAACFQPSTLKVMVI